MPDAYLEQVCQGVETALAAISQGSGYYTNAGAAVSIMREADDAPVRSPILDFTAFTAVTADDGQIDCALWVEFGGERQARDVSDLTRWRSVMDVVVWIYVKSKTPRADLLKLLADVRRAVLKYDWPAGMISMISPGETQNDLGTLAFKGLGELATVFELETRDWSADTQ